MVLSSSIAKCISLLAQIGDSTSDLSTMFIESEWTIREHCDSLRQRVDIARVTAIENIHKASNTLMVDIDAYEHNCLSGWTTVKEGCRRCLQAGESVPRRAPRISAKCPRKRRRADTALGRGQQVRTRAQRSQERAQTSHVRKQTRFIPRVSKLGRCVSPWRIGIQRHLTSIQDTGNRKHRVQAD